jgi:hypothetical protein
MARASLLALLVVAAPAAAQAPVAPEAFEAMAEGRTMHFTLGGEIYGAEQYFAGRRSLWRYADGTCDSGRWWAEGELICFAYVREPGPQCWRFVRRGAGFAAALVEEGADTGLVLDLSRTDAAPLPCPGPDLGS